MMNNKNKKKKKKSQMPTSACGILAFTGHKHSKSFCLYTQIPCGKQFKIC